MIGTAEKGGTHLPATAGALVISGGAVGLSVAYRRTKAGVRDALDVERRHLRAQLARPASRSASYGLRADMAKQLELYAAQRVRSLMAIDYALRAVPALNYR